MIVSNAITFFGGLALFVYGVELLSNAMRTLAGKRLRQIMEKVVRHRGAGLIAGLVITVLLQSSSASTVLFVSMVQGGLLAFKDTVAMILGAMIGTTLTVQLIAFNITQYALLPVAIGIVIVIMSRYERLKLWGTALIGIGFIFFGMAVMKQGVMPLRESELFTRWFQYAIGMPWLSFLTAVLFTAVVQASAATMAVIFSFAEAGLLGTGSQEILLHALPFVFGANVGTTITALLSSIKTSRAARRCALAHTFLKLSGAVVCMFAIGPIARLTGMLSPGVGIIRLIANSHTLFNVMNVIVFLPFTKQISGIFTRLVPDTKETVIFPGLRMADYSSLDKEHLRPKLTDALVALAAMVQNAIRHISVQYSELAWNRLEDIAAEDGKIDEGYKEIRDCCTLVYRLPSEEINRETVLTVIRFAELLERLGDDFTRSTIRILRKMLADSLSFSFSSVGELQSLMRRFSEILEDIALNVSGNQRHNHDEIKQMVDSAREKLEAMRRAHFQSITDDIPLEVSSSTHYLDILSEMESSVSKLETLTVLAEKISA